MRLIDLVICVGLCTLSIHTQDNIWVHLTLSFTVALIILATHSSYTLNPWLVNHVNQLRGRHQIKRDTMDTVIAAFSYHEYMLEQQRRGFKVVLQDVTESRLMEVD